MQVVQQCRGKRADMSNVSNMPLQVEKDAKTPDQKLLTMSRWSKEQIQEQTKREIEVRLKIVLKSGTSQKRGTEMKLIWSGTFLVTCMAVSLLVARLKVD